MRLTKLQQTLRSNIIEQLLLLSSAEDQLRYQRDVPLVNITVELVCGWFDDHYIPEDKAFRSAFSEQELRVMAEFDRAFDAISSRIPWNDEVPRIETLIQAPEWMRLSQAASVALLAFGVGIEE